MSPRPAPGASARFCENPDCSNFLSGRQLKYCSKRCSATMTHAVDGNQAGPGRPYGSRNGERKEQRSTVFGLPQRPHSADWEQRKQAMRKKYPAYKPRETENG